MDHPNAERIRSAYEAFFKGEAGAFDALLADDVRWHSGGRNTLTGDFEGKSGVYEFFGKVTEGTGDTFKATLHDVLANDRHATVLVQYSVERHGKRGSGDVVQVMDLEDGRIKEVWIHEGDQHLVDEIWG